MQEHTACTAAKVKISDCGGCIMLESDSVAAAGGTGGEGMKCMSFFDSKEGIHVQ